MRRPVEGQRSGLASTSDCAYLHGLDWNLLGVVADMRTLGEIGNSVQVPLVDARAAVYASSGVPQSVDQQD
jgi:hypothetical protein